MSGSKPELPPLPERFPARGSRWLHRKSGDIYLVDRVYRDESALEIVRVGYVSDDRLAIGFSRPLAEWYEEVLLPGDAAPLPRYICKDQCVECGCVTRPLIRVRWKPGGLVPPGTSPREKADQWMCANCWASRPRPATPKRSG